MAKEMYGKENKEQVAKAKVDWRQPTHSIAVLAVGPCEQPPTQEGQAERRRVPPPSSAGVLQAMAEAAT